MDPTIGLILILAYLPAGLIVLLAINAWTGRVRRFVGSSDTKFMLVIGLWPVVLPILFFPRFKARRDGFLFGTQQPYYGRDLRTRKHW